MEKNSYLSVICIYDTIFLDERMFGEVISDDRFEKGHIIQTSPILDMDKEQKIVKTKGGTIYHYDTILSEEEFLEYCKQNHNEDRYNFIKSALVIRR